MRLSCCVIVWDSCRIAVGMLWRLCRILLWRRFGIVVGLLWDRGWNAVDCSGIAVVLLWDCCGIAMGLL